VKEQERLASQKKYRF
jgi:hypothetical protein